MCKGYMMGLCKTRANLKKMYKQLFLLSCDSGESPKNQLV